jgi:lysophospholipase L1-like esterase
MPRTTHLLGSLIIVILVVGLAEFMAYVTSRQLVKYAIGFTPLYITESYEDYLKQYDPRLGWKSSVLDDAGNYRALASSAASSGLHQEHSPACVSLYGDSFTEGFGVTPKHSWGYLLSQFLHCRVANFGVAGYGTDQAYLRFLDNHGDRAKVVILGFLSENIIRNVNQLWNLIGDASSCQLKPRFFLNEIGQLTLAPLPHLTREQYYALPTHPETMLHHEYFLPGGPSGYRGMAFPYTWGIFKVFPIIFKNVILHQGTYYDLYRPGNPSHAVAVTLAIIEAFGRKAKQRGQQPLILVIPTHVDLANYRSHGTWIYQPITDELARKGLHFIDLGPKFSHFLGDGPVETLYSPKSMYHLSERGNALLAGIVYNYLKQKDPGLGKTGETNTSRR